MRSFGYRASLLAVSTLAFFGACADQPPAPTGDGRVTINSDPSDLSDQVEPKDEPVDVQPAGAPNALVFLPEPEYALTLVAEVAPPQVDGALLQATSVTFDGERAVVSYNTAGDTQQGAVDVFVLDDLRHPQLTSRATFTDTDVHAVTASAGRVWLATATADESLGTPAVLEGLTLSDGGLLTLDNHVRVGLSSFAATSVTVGDGRLYATSGSAGGVYAFDAVTGQAEAFVELSDARWVAAPHDGKLVVVQGTPGRLAVRAAADLSAIASYPFDGADIAESKSTVQLLGGKAFIAGGSRGAFILELATGVTLAQLPPPTGLPIAPAEVVTNAVSADGTLIFVSNGAAGVYLVSAAASLDSAYDPKVGLPELTEVGRLSFSGAVASVNHIAYKDGFLFVATGRGGLKIVRVERLVPIVTPPSGYPYVTDFGDESARAGWQLSGQWGWGAPDGERSGVAGPFLDNDPSLADQYHRSGDLALLDLPLAIPATGSPTLSFVYRAAFLSSDDEVKVQIKKGEGGEWKTALTFDFQSQRADLARRSFPLDDYRGESIRLRFRQTMDEVHGARTFTLDDLAVAPLELPVLSYPFVTSFESGLDRARWNLEGRWEWSADDAFDGTMKLDANPKAALLSDYDHGQTAELMGFIPVPSSGDPVVGFWYRSDLVDEDDEVELAIQTQGESDWSHLVRLTSEHDHADWTYEEASLADYAGKNVRLRFAFAFKGEEAAPVFVADSLRVGPLAAGAMPYPYADDFEGSRPASEWASQGVLKIAALSDGGNGIVADLAPSDADLLGEARMLDEVPVPSEGPVLLSFRGNLGLADGDLVLVEAQRHDEASWRTLASYGGEQRHAAWTRYEVPLDDLLGQRLRLRFRAAFGPATGPRTVAIDDLEVSSLPAARLPYPFAATLDEAGLSSWAVNGSWTPVDGTLDANPQGRSQAQWGSGHEVAMPGYVVVPDSGRPTLLVKLLLAFTDPTDRLLLELQTADAAAWTPLRSYTWQMNRQDFGWDEIPLEAWGGQAVRVRLRYELGPSTVPRQLRLGDLRLEDLAPPHYDYPWGNGCESAGEVAEWSLWGAWGSSGPHGASQPGSGDAFLDGNPGDLASSAASGLTATLVGDVAVPLDSAPWLTFSHHFGAVHPDDQLGVEVQPSYGSDWTRVATLTSQHARLGYSEVELPLSSWRGKSLRVRFVMTLGATDLVRQIGLDDVAIGPLALPQVEAPVTTDFAHAGNDVDWALHGLWDHASDALHANPQGLDVGGYDTFQTATLAAFVNLERVSHPELEVTYSLALKDPADRAYIELLRPGASQWVQLATFTVQNNTSGVVAKTLSLEGYEAVRVRFRVTSALTAGSRDFAIRSVTIGSER